MNIYFLCSLKSPRLHGALFIFYLPVHTKKAKATENDTIFGGSMHIYWYLSPWRHLFQNLRFPFTVEPWYNEPLFNEVFGITNDFLYPSNSKMYEKEPQYNETPL